MIPVDIYKKIFPTLNKKLQASGATCRALEMPYDCAGCVLEIDNSCFLYRDREDYQLFLEQHPEFLV